MYDGRVMLGFVAVLALALVPSICQSAETQATKSGASAPAASHKQIERGRYMVVVGSCNDCHTSEFAARNGNVPEKEWLLGSGPLGFRGPWGTTYAPNLRLTVSRLTESEWVRFAKELKSRPPMPWFQTSRFETTSAWRTVNTGSNGHPALQLQVRSPTWPGPGETQSDSRFPTTIPRRFPPDSQVLRSVEGLSD